MRKKLVVATLLACISGGAFAAPPVDEAQTLIQRGQPAAAWELLAPHEGQMAGNADYDYLLGISALDSGRPGRAVLALERVLLVNPGHTAARADLARAYLAQGERKNAEEAFQQVARSDVSPVFKANVERYLNVLAQQPTAEVGTRWTRWVEAGFGYDSNVNSATADSQVALPVLNGAIGVIDPLGQERDDWFLRFGGGIGVEHSISSDLAFIGGVSGGMRELGDDSNSPFETYDINAVAGLRRKIDTASNVSGTAFYQNFGVDHEAYRGAWGFNGQYVRSLDEQSAISAQTQWARLDYPDQPVRDADRWQLGLGYARAMTPATTGFVGLAVGQEKQDADARPDLGNDFWSIRVGLIHDLSPEMKVRAIARHERRDYDGLDPLFWVVREDRQTDLDLALDYKPSKQVTVTPKVSWTSNDSNSPINDYDRTQGAVNVRYDFD